MRYPNADGFVMHYFVLFCQLGAQSEQGEDVLQRVSILVENVIKHLDVWRPYGPTDHTSKLIAQLKTRSECIAGSSPVQAKLLSDAAEQLRKHLWR